MFSPAFNHERYSRPCVCYGTFDGGKNNGLVVHDLCVRAAAFLRSIGKGDPHELTRRDFTYDPSLYPPSSSPQVGSSQVSDASGDVEMSADVTLTQAMFDDAAEQSDDEFNDDGFFQDEDVQEMLGLNEGVADADLSTTVTLSDIPSSQDSAEQDLARGSSTKMRAATLGYLWNFANDPRQLRLEFRRLRSEANLCVLHLCGCGLCYRTSNDIKVFGCAERTHLKLGLQEQNGHHRTFHQMLELGPVGAYAQQVTIIHQSTDGDGVF